MKLKNLAVKAVDLMTELGQSWPWLISAALARKLCVVLGVGILGVLAVAACAAALAGVLALEGLVIWALWNALVPSLAGGPSVTYVQGVLLGIVLNVIGAVIGKS